MAAPVVIGPDDGKTITLIGALKASSAQTGGSFEIIDYRGPLQPPPHVHREHEEAFFILAGTFTFVLGTDEVEANTGSLVIIPRGTRHGFRTGADGRALLFIVPGGLEGFFEELGTAVAAGKTSDDIRAALAGKYDSIPTDA